MNKLEKALNIRNPLPTSCLYAVQDLLGLERESDSQLEFPLLDAVGRGSPAHPVTVVQHPEKLKKGYTGLVLVGKGVVYDSGGYAIKPARSAVDMFFDKTGAVLTLYLGKKLKLPTVTFWVSNLVGERSLLNGEIITSRNGTKVLVSNTDAEGRLGLADSLSYVKELSPKAHAVTLATLTGAAAAFTGEGVRALVHSTNYKDLYPKLINTMDDHLLFPAPISKKYDEAVKTKVLGADINNISNMNGGGSQTAFSFLKHFHNNLTHVDMAAFCADKEGNAIGHHLVKSLKLLIGLLS